MADKLSLIWVKGTGTDKVSKGKVVLWERHVDHPKTDDTKELGEVLVSNDGKKHQVAETKEVRRLIGEGLLERVGWNSKSEDDEPKNKGGRPKAVAPKKSGGKEPVKENTLFNFQPPPDEPPSF